MTSLPQNTPQPASSVPIENPGAHRPGPRSKISKLPPDQRALLNQRLAEGVPFHDICAEINQLGADLNHDNLSKWFNGPYQDYLAAIEWQEQLQSLRDSVTDSAPETLAARFQEQLIQIGLTQVFRDLKDDRFHDDPMNAIRLYNSLARLSREALVLRKYADQQTREKEIELKRLDPSRKLTELEEDAMQDRADAFFGLKSAARIREEISRSSQLQEAPTPALESTPPPAAVSSSPLPSAPPQPATPLHQLHSSPASHRTAGERSESRPANTPASTSPQIENPPPSKALRAKEEKPKMENLPSSSIEHPESRFMHHVSRSHPASIPDYRPATSGSAQIKIQKSKFKNLLELCPNCRRPLPPLLPTGERPGPHCNHCGSSLRPPGALIEYCPNPKCNQLLPELRPDGTRPVDTCNHCNKLLPPPPSEVLLAKEGPPALSCTLSQTLSPTSSDTLSNTSPPSPQDELKPAA